jgi:phage shock protein PspC (stress-responsive transcriptional regulator)
MKRNISINISGIIFYIEEDGYDKLKDYLDSINRYFAKFDDSSEIVSDIESRIAEIFLSKLKDGRQVILLEDVESLIATMGSVKDFKAVEEPEELFEEEQFTETESGAGAEYKPRRIYRDTRRKAIGGVAAGLGHYFNIDPIWFRILFLVFFISFLFEFGISIAIVVVYVALWIIIPGSDELPYERKYKKMFRNPDDKVLGGVASGVAKYFGIDVVLVRLLFVVFIFVAFSGLVAYVILWIILPEARTITDKMEMEGELVTLSNIEANIKRSLNVKEGEENTFLKILLFPFRVIAALLDGITKNLGPFLKILVDAVRIIAGVVFTIIGSFSLVFLIVIFGVLIGIFATGNLEFLNILPIQVIKQTIPTVIYVSTFAFLLVPFLFIAIIGLMIISKKNLIRPTVGWSLFAVWIASIFALAFSIPPVVQDFSRSATREEVEFFNVEQVKITTLRFNKLDGFNDFTTLTLRGHDEPEFKLVKKYEAKGKNSQDALENTKTVFYQVQQMDSVLIFDSNIRFHQDAVFRMQKMSMTLYIPYHQHFRMDSELSRILRNTLSSHGYSSSDIRDNVWEFTEEGLKCITCPVKDPEHTEKTNIAIEEPREASGNSKIDGGQVFQFRDFNAIDAGSVIQLEIVAGNEYNVAAYGSKKDLNFLDISQEGNMLRIRSKKEDLLGQSKIKVVINLPEITNLELHGASRTHVTNLRSESLLINLSGAAFADMDINANRVDLKMTGSSKLRLRGGAENLKASLSGISTLDAIDCAMNEVNIATSSSADAKLSVKNVLYARTDGSSAISYQGNPQVVGNNNFSSIKKIK